MKVKLTTMVVHSVSDKAPNSNQNCYSQTRYYQHCIKHTVAKCHPNLTALCTYGEFLKITLLMKTLFTIENDPKDK